MLLLHALGQPTHARAWLLAHDDDALAPDAAERMRVLAARRMAGEPMAYLTGEKHFHGLRLTIDARVLDPRDDTETLVDWALDLLPLEAPRRVLDLGTGSGAIALAIAQRRPQARVTATDASADALAVARANGQRLGLPVDWRHGDWFAPVAGQSFDLIVSNPPYIAEGDAHLPALAHEPRSALVSGADGLDDLRSIVAAAGAHLRPGCCWSTAGTRRRPCARCWPRRTLPMCARNAIWQESSVARAGAGRTEGSDCARPRRR